MKAYLLLAAHPLISIPYEPKEAIAIATKRPNSKSNIVKPSANGIIDQPNKEKINVMKGPIINNLLLACLGIIISLNNNFNASANGCNKPKIEYSSFSQLLYNTG